MNYFIAVLKKYAVFTGRARRSEFWYFVLFNAIISWVLSFVFGLIGLPIVSSLYSLAVLLPSIGVAIRRMHDINKSGWFILIPIYNIILWAQAGDQGENQYGPDPKA